MKDYKEFLNNKDIVDRQSGFEPVSAVPILTTVTSA
jgi:hypothetical protein